MDRRGSDYSLDSLHGRNNHKKNTRCKNICRTVMRFLFSHIGLFFLLIGYCCVGALIFQALENDMEKERVGNSSQVHKKIANHYQYNRTRTNLLNLSNKTATEFATQLKMYQDYLESASLEHSYSGRKETTEKNRWEFPSALLFAVSTITLIGYGHVAPVTQWGKIVVIPFAIFGIPLTLMFLANVGELLARFVRFVVVKTGCRKRRREEDDDEEQKNWTIIFPILLTILILVVYTLIGAAMFQAFEGWSYLESVYFCYVTLTTIGYGDYVPGLDDIDTSSGKGRLAISSLYIIFGLAFLSMGMSLIVDELMHTSKKLGMRLGIVDERGESGGQKVNLAKYVKRKPAKI